MLWLPPIMKGGPSGVKVLREIKEGLHTRERRIR
jgi:hypothetical protein